MAVVILLEEGFEHGPDGSDIGTGETEFADVEGRYDNDQVHSGALAFLNGIIGGAPALSGGTFLFPDGLANVAISGWVYADGALGDDVVDGGAWAFEVGSGVLGDGTSEGLVVGQYLRELLPDLPLDPADDPLVLAYAVHVAADDTHTYDFLAVSESSAGRWPHPGWHQFTMAWPGGGHWTVSIGADLGDEAFTFDTGDLGFTPVGFQFYALSPSDDGLSRNNWMDDFLITTTTGGAAAVRLYPRDDNLGLGSAPRIYPPSKARRLVGGYQ